MLRTEKKIAIICPSSGNRWTVFILEKDLNEQIKIGQILWEGKSIINAAEIVNQWLKGNI